jgi:hypothetical protein
LLRSRLQSQAIALWEIEILMVQTDVDKYGGLFRQVARRAGIGRALLRVNDFRATGLQAILKKAYAKHVLLPRIFEARPMSSRSGLEVHMLLNHRRVSEGSWTLYSFAHFLAKPCRFIVHSDGSLNELDSRSLKLLFPGLRVVTRSEADTRVLDELVRRNLHRCTELRQSFIFSLKLFDPYLYSESKYFIMLDSDILTYRHPQLIGDLAQRRQCFFSEDNGYRACVSRLEFEQLAGTSPSANCNAGLLGVAKQAVDFDTIERWLESSNFWRNNKPSYYAEQTIWSLLMARNRAECLGRGYDICSPCPESEDTICGHYCGGGYWPTLFYWRGLPFLAKRFAEAGVMPI